jgi:hypothetical protein
MDLHEVVGTRLHTIGQCYASKRQALVEALLRARNPIAVPTSSGGAPQSSLYRNLLVLE